MDSRYLIQLSYKGTRYRGWQRQPEVSTIQETVEDWLSKQVEYRVSVIGCGRTDAGVHAINYCAHVDADGLPNIEVLPDIVIHGISEVDRNFHAQHRAKWRTYQYLIRTSDLSEMAELSSRYYFSQLDPDLLSACASALCDISDFRAFCKRPADYRNTLCNVREAKWMFSRDKSVFKFQITANRFLRGMVRFLVASMLDCASGRMSWQDWQGLLTGRIPRGSVAPAYANGLYLTSIEYEGVPVESVDLPAFFEPVKTLIESI